jgi:predicted nuclease with TOPRIM domain
MNPLEQHILRIQEKLQLLLKQHQAVLKENERLRRELADVKVHEKVMSGQLSQLEQQVAVLKTATSNLGPEDKKDLEKRLNFFIREIEKCITLLNG